MKLTAVTKTEPSVLQGRSLHSEGHFFLLAAPLDTINIHLRGGHIIPLQVGLHSWRNESGLTQKIPPKNQHNLHLFTVTVFTV